MNFTEAGSRYDNLENMPLGEVLRNINKEDSSVFLAVEKSIPQIEKLVAAVTKKLKSGGRLFYIGAGTSGRLGILDASECPPTFGVPEGLVVGIIAGGDAAIRKPVEHAEDESDQAWKDLQEYKVDSDDVVIGITASGSTPYVVGGLNKCQQQNILTGCITCNLKSLVAAVSDFPIEVITGPEFLTGSTRMKAGTAQKMVLNMISTSVMIQLGRVKGNKMVDMQLNNNKLFNRGIKMIMEELKVEREVAETLLNKFGNVRTAIQGYKKDA